MRKHHKCATDVSERCENNFLCHLCDGVALYKNSKEEAEQKREQAAANKEAAKHAPLKTYQKDRKEGMTFEKKVAKQWNNHMNPTKKTVKKPRLDMLIDQAPEPDVSDHLQDTTVPLLRQSKPEPKPKQEAKRQANSGAMWHAKGDIKLEHALMECKERGTVSSKGKKQITIPKEWLDKQEKEAFQEQRPYWYLPFGFKGEDDVYLIKPYDQEMELIYELRQAREEIDRLRRLAGETTDE